MTADELLAKLGYEKIADNGKTFIYQKRFNNEPEKITKTITFFSRDKDISVETYLEDELEITLLSVVELQAITAKTNELGWSK